jgi:hypothetical protein
MRNQQASIRILNATCEEVMGITNNPIIMDFLKTEATSKVASEMNATEDSIAVKVAEGDNETAARFNSYMTVGIATCLAIRKEVQNGQS